jgi:hypothetical protein
MNMVIRAGETEIQVDSVIREIAQLDGVPKQVMRIATDAPLIDAQLAALTAGDWVILESGKEVGRHAGYNTILRYELLVTKTDDAQREIARVRAESEAALRALQKKLDERESAADQAQLDLEEALEAARSGLIAAPVSDGTWNAVTRYIKGDKVSGFVALRYSRDKDPVNPENIGTYWAVDSASGPAVLVWSEIPDLTVIEVDTVVKHGSQTWICTARHLKSVVFTPKAGSLRWVLYE